MTELQFRSLDRWPRTPTAVRVRARFSDDYGKTIALLERELRHLKARDVVVLADCAESDLRRDGTLRAGCRLRSPGIVLCFNGKHGPVRMPCDRYDDWRDNLRAIAVSLEALRAVDRHGVTTSGEQYRGWTALPPAAGAEGMTVDAAAAEISTHAPFISGDWIKTDVEAFRTALRTARVKTHPDKGGSEESFKRIELAADVLRRHHGVTE